MPNATILVGDVRERLATLADGSVQTCVTSPPYWGLRDYGHDGQIGLEQTPDAYVAEMVEVFREVRRVLADDGTCWVNLGDSYGPGKQLAGIPWRVAFALQADGWWLRQDIIWAKPNPMPESVTDRCTKAHEYLFLLTKSARYYYDAASVNEPVADGTAERYAYGFGQPDKKAAIVETGKWHTGKGGRDNLSGDMEFHPTRNRRSVWTIATKPFSGAHFAVMPEALVEPCVLAGSRPGDLVLDPFAGSGTVGVVALKHGRDFVGTELNPEYAALAEARIRDDGPLFNEVEVA
jgi:DNA modification methylase